MADRFAFSDTAHGRNTGAIQVEQGSREPVSCMHDQQFVSNSPDLRTSVITTGDQPSSTSGRYATVGTGTLWSGRLVVAPVDALNALRPSFGVQFKPEPF